jgi:hypothetical protein
VTALGLCFNGWRSDPIEFRDRAQNFAAMTQQDSEVLEVLLRQITEHRDVNAVLGEALGVFTQADRC